MCNCPSCNLMARSLSKRGPANRQNIMRPLKPCYRQEIWRLLFQNRRAVTHCVISKPNGNAYVHAQKVKIDTRRASAASLYLLRMDIFEDFHFDPPTEENNYYERMTPSQKGMHKTTRDVKPFLKFCRCMYIARSVSPPQT